jgi:hypothetical protein
MTVKRKIIDARADTKGNIEAVKLDGNKTWTSLDTAIGMTKKGHVDAVYVKPLNAKEHLRTPPDKRTKNNLDSLAGQ